MAPTIIDTNIRREAPHFLEQGRESSKDAVAQGSLVGSKKFAPGTLWKHCNKCSPLLWDRVCLLAIFLWPNLPTQIWEESATLYQGRLWLILGSKSFEQKAIRCCFWNHHHHQHHDPSSLCFGKTKGLMKEAARGRCCVHKGGGLPRINMKDQQSPPIKLPTKII